MMEINRRKILGLGSLLLVGSGALVTNKNAFAKESASSSLFLSAASDANDKHWVVGFRISENETQLLFKHELPGRAHHIAVHEERGLYVVVARRPGKYLMLGELATGKLLSEIEVPANRHLFGHGVFSENGLNFYTTESDFQDLSGDSGRVAVWKILQASNVVMLERSHSFPSYGVGPHELLLLPDQQTLVVANGGIRTHPDSGREKLNLPTMEPSLVYLSAESGEKLEQKRLPAQFHQSSIRHLDINIKEQVVFAAQYQGEMFESVPLLGLHTRGNEIDFLMAPLEAQSQMKQYVGAVRFDKSGDFIAASCPRGNMITFWSSASGELIGQVRSRDGCGVSATEKGFLFTAGTGRISHYDLVSGEVTDSPELEASVFWDNHLTKVT